MLKIPTIADKYPEGTEALRRAGYPCIADLAGHYRKFADMDRALGYAAAAHHWFNGRDAPSGAAEVAAKALLSQAVTQNPPRPASPKVKPAAPEKREAILMVVCPAEKAESAKRLLSVLGCEVEPI